MAGQLPSNSDTSEVAADFQSWRSWLYVPGDRPDRIAKALLSDADCVIIDLEDAVAPSHKETARNTVVRTLAETPAKPTLVRINAAGSPWYKDDIRALATTAASGVRIPKAERPQQIEQTAEKLSTKREIPLHLLIESAAGLCNIEDLAKSHTSVVSVALGEADLMANLAISDEKYLGYARGRVVAAARAAGLIAPPQSVFTDLSDDHALLHSTMNARAAGFFGRAVIHPRQLPVVNSAFIPTDAEVDEAQLLLDSLESVADSAVLVLSDGRFVDLAVAANAKRTLDLAARYGMRSAAEANSESPTSGERI